MTRRKVEDYESIVEYFLDEIAKITKKYGVHPIQLIGTAKGFELELSQNIYWKEQEKMENQIRKKLSQISTIPLIAGNGIFYRDVASNPKSRKLLSIIDEIKSSGTIEGTFWYGNQKGHRGGHRMSIHEAIDVMRHYRREGIKKFRFDSEPHYFRRYGISLTGKEMEQVARTLKI